MWEVTRKKSSKMPSTNHKPLNLLYTKHLKDNGRRYLTKIVVGRRKGRLFKSIFGHDGLIVMIRFLLNKNSPIWIVFLSNFRNNFQKRLKPLQGGFTSSAKRYSEQALQ